MTRSDGIRPAWHRDAKWIFRILFTISLFFTLLAYEAFNFTSFEFVLSIGKPVIKNSLNLTGMIAQNRESLNAFAASNPDAFVEVPRELDVKIKGRDVIKMSDDEIADKVLDVVLKDVYSEGSGAKVSKLLESKKASNSDPGPLVGLVSGIFNKKTHESLQAAWRTLAFFSFLLLLPYLYFSEGFAKLTSPGMSIALASFPFAVIAFAGRSFGLDGMAKQTGVLFVVGVSLFILGSICLVVNYVRLNRLGPVKTGIPWAHTNHDGRR